MKVHSDYLTVQTKQKREFMNITPNVKFAVEKNGVRDGVALVSALHPNSAVFVNDEEPGLLQDLNEWLEKLAPQRDDTSTGRNSRATPASTCKACWPISRSWCRSARASSNWAPGSR